MSNPIVAPVFHPKTDSGENFQVWRTRIEAYVALTFTKSEQSMGLNTLRFLCNDPAFLLIINTSSGFTSALNKLEKRFGFSREERKTRVMGAFSEFKAQPDERLSDSILRLQSIIKQCQREDIEINDDLILFKLRYVCPTAIHNLVKVSDEEDTDEAHHLHELMDFIADEYGHLKPRIDRSHEKPIHHKERQKSTHSSRPEQRHDKETMKVKKDMKPCFKCKEPWFPGHTCMKTERIAKIVECQVDTGAEVNVFGRNVMSLVRKTGKTRMIKGLHSNPKALQEGKITIEKDNAHETITGVIDPSHPGTLINPDSIHLQNNTGNVSLGTITTVLKKRDKRLLINLDVQETGKPYPHKLILKLLQVDPACLADYSFEDALLYGIRTLHRRLLHPCSYRLFNTLRDLFPRFNVSTSTVEQAVGNCEECQIRNQRHEHVNKVKETFHLKLYADLGDMQVQSKGCQYLSVIRASSGHYFLKALQNRSKAPAHVRTVIETLKEKGEKILSLHTDQAPEYLMLEAELNELGIKLIKSPILSDESNGAAEVAVREAKRYIRTALDEFRFPEYGWKDLVPAAETALNATYTKGVSAVPNRELEKGPLYLLPTDLVVVKNVPDNVSYEHPGSPGYFVGWESPTTAFIMQKTPEDEWVTKVFHLRSISVVLRKPPKTQLRLGEEGNSSLSLLSSNIYALSETKQRNASPIEVKNGLFATADKEEIQKYFDMEALKEVNERKVGYSTIPTMFVRCWKLKEGVWVPKSRLVVRGDLEKNPSHDTWVSLGGLTERIVGLLLGLETQQPLYFADVSSAFLHSPIERRRFVKINGKTYELMKGAYGLNNAPKLFIDYVHACLDKLKWIKLCSGVYKKNEELLIVYVDDFAIFSNNIEKTYGELSTVLKFDKPVPVEGVPQRFVGTDVWRGKDCIFLSQDSYIQTVVPPNSSGNITASSLECDETKAPEPNLLSAIRSALGKVGYISTFDPKYSFLHSRLSSIGTQHPCKKSLNSCSRLLKHICTAPRHIRTLRSAPSYILYLYTDASYKVQKKSAHVGFKLFLTPSGESPSDDVNLLMFKSRKVNRLISSTFGAELEAIKFAMSCSLKFLHGFEALPLNLERNVLKVDNYPLVRALHNETCDDGFSIADLKFVCKQLKEQKFEIEWTDSSSQLADELTKFIPSIFRVHCQEEGVVMED